MVKRITIFGPPGSGKTTFSLKLAKHLNYPLLHIDKIFFQKDFVESDPEGFLKDFIVPLFLEVMNCRQKIHL